MKSETITLTLNEKQATMLKSLIGKTRCKECDESGLSEVYDLLLEQYVQSVDLGIYIGEKGGLLECFQIRKIEEGTK